MLLVFPHDRATVRDLLEPSKFLARQGALFHKLIWNEPYWASCAEEVQQSRVLLGVLHRRAWRSRPPDNLRVFACMHTERAPIGKVC